MRNARKVLMLAIMAVVAMAFAASTAAAQTPLEVTNEALENPCGEVTLVAGEHEPEQPGVNCLLHANGEAELRKHVFGIESKITTCSNEYHGMVDEDANGFIFEQILTNDGANVCNRQACKVDGEATPWPAFGREGSTGSNPPLIEGDEYLTTTFCVEPIGGGTDESCEIDVPFNETSPGSHVYEFGHSEPPFNPNAPNESSGHGFSGFRCELVGHWVTETGGTEDGKPEVNVEVSHV